MDLHIRLPSDNEKDSSLKIDNISFHKMVFLYNALNEGWTVKKRKESYVFTKPHEGKKEVFLESYLMSFMKNNIDLNKLLI
jgi:hypothetical protein